MRIKIHRGLVYTKPKSLPKYVKAVAILPCIEEAPTGAERVPNFLCKIEGREQVSIGRGRIYYKLFSKITSQSRIDYIRWRVEVS